MSQSTEPRKMNVLLAMTDHLAKPFKESIKDYRSFFKDKQGMFKGELKTYEPEPDVADDPSMRGNKIVATTVGEKLKWLEDVSKEYIDCLFSQEATNAAGTAKAPLIVDDTNFGTFSALELLRMKSILDDGDLVGMYENIPVRADDEEWTPTDRDEYKDREIFDGKKNEGIKKTLQKESFILTDPNIERVKGGAPYVPQIAQKDTVKKLGEYTYQKFSGEWSHRQRAELLRRRTMMLNAVIAALKVANDTPCVTSTMTAEKLFGYLHGGKQAS